jgi:hypothetical protein
MDVAMASCTLRTAQWLGIRVEVYMVRVSVCRVRVSLTNYHLPLPWFEVWNVIFMATSGGGGGVGGLGQHS